MICKRPLAKFSQVLVPTLLHLHSCSINLNRRKMLINKNYLSILINKLSLYIQPENGESN